MSQFLDLQFFADGAAAGAAGGAESGSNSGLSGDFDSDFAAIFGGAAPSPVAGEKTEDTQDAVTEAQDAAQEAQSQSSGDETNAEQTDPDAEFEKLIKGKYHDQFSRRTQGIIDNRFKQTKQLEKQNADLMEVLAPLFDKYGIENSDYSKLGEAIKGDSANFLQQALENDMPVDAYRENFYAARANAQQQAEAQAQAEADQAMENIRKKFTEWTEAEKLIKNDFPDFDLRREINTNPAFKAAIEQGTPVDVAYYGTNFKNLATGMVAAAAQNAGKKAAQSIAQNAARPRETGTRVGTGVNSVQKSVADMTEADILALMERAAKGEVISL